MEEWRDSDASSASRKRPGIMYVRDRKADSICVTEDWLLAMKELYLERRARGEGGVGREGRCDFEAAVAFAVADLSASMLSREVRDARTSVVSWSWWW